MAAFNIEIEQEVDGRWTAEVPELPGVMVYGQSRQEAVDRVQAVTLRVLADRLEHAIRLAIARARFAALFHPANET